MINLLPSVKVPRFCQTLLFIYNSHNDLNNPSNLLLMLNLNYFKSVFRIVSFTFEAGFTI